MKLLQKLKSKKETSELGKIRSFTYGLYECPYCNNSIELRMQKGNKQKSCGSKECLIKSHSDGYNHELSSKNAGNTIHNYTNNPYYNSLKNYYNNINKKDLSVEWQTLSEFLHDNINEYSILKNKNIKLKLKLLKINKNLLFSQNNSLWKTVHESVNLLLNENIGELNSRNLAKELNSHHRNVIKGIKRLKQTVNNFGNTIDKIISVNNNKIKIIGLSEKQYEIVKNFIQSNKINTNSSIIYLIQSIYVDMNLNIKRATKIGIASNINKRLQALSSSSPHKMILKYSIELDNVKKIEKELHKKYKDNNIKNEWFNLEPEEVTSIQEYLDKLHEEENKK